MLLGERTETVEVMEQTGLLHRITSCGRRAAAQLSIDGTQTPDIDRVVLTTPRPEGTRILGSLGLLM